MRGRRGCWRVDRRAFRVAADRGLTLAGTGPGVVIVLGAVGIFVGTIQAVLMLFRQAALLVSGRSSAAAAAGTLAAGTRAWFRRVTGWMLALIFYKPAAAAVYATAFTLIGSRPSPRTKLMGFAMVILSLVALPALMKFFTWTVGTVEASSAGGGFLSTVLSGAVAIGAVRGAAGGLGGATAADQARVISGRLDSPSAGAQGARAAGGGLPTGPASSATGRGPQTVASAGARPARRCGHGHWDCPQGCRRRCRARRCRCCRRWRRGDRCCSPGCAGDAAAA